MIAYGSDVVRRSDFQVREDAPLRQGITLSTWSSAGWILVGVGEFHRHRSHHLGELLGDVDLIRPRLIHQVASGQKGSSRRYRTLKRPIIANDVSTDSAQAYTYAHDTCHGIAADEFVPVVSLSLSICSTR